MNKLLITVGVIFLICMLVGYARGLVKIVASLIASIVTIVLVVLLTPYLSSIIMKVTPIENFAQEKCVEILRIEAQESDIDASEGRDSIIETIYSREEQIAVLENAEIPEVLRQMLLENNNVEIYEMLGVTTFGEYIGSYLAKVFSDIISFLIIMVVVTIIIRVILYILGIISSLPVIGGINRLAGGVLGLGTGLIVVWVIFIAITLMYDTELGQRCLADITESRILTLLYEKNILMEYITKFRG